MDIINLADVIRRDYYTKAGIPPRTQTLVGLACGLDTALTILESSIGPFETLTREAAVRISDYFKEEAAKVGPENKEVAIWYLSYAEAIERLFIRG